MRNINHSRSLNILKERGLFAFLQYRFFKQSANLIIPLFYKLNKPLPHTYQFLFLTHHATGHNAMMYFLRLCNIFIDGDVQDISGIERYKNNYKRLIFYTRCALSLCEWNFKDFNKYTRLLNAKVPALLLVRDPISILKTCINFVSNTQDKQIIGGGGQNKLFEYLQYNAYNPKTKEFHLCDSPCLDNIEFYVIQQQDKEALHSLFILHKLLAALPQITQKCYVDMEEIKPHRAFETMQTLSQKLDFPPPKEEDRIHFEKQVYAHLYFLFPFHLMITTKDSEIKLLFANRTKNIKGIDITEQLMPPSYQNNPNLENCKVFVKTQREAQEVSKHFVQVQAELITTLETLLQIVESKKSKALSEEDVLKYFASHPKIAKEFKAICDKDLQDLKAQRPDIVESWKYYQEFEKICEGLEG